MDKSDQGNNCLQYNTKYRNIVSVVTDWYDVSEGKITQVLTFCSYEIFVKINLGSIPTEIKLGGRK